MNAAVIAWIVVGGLLALTLKPSTRVFPISCKNGTGVNEVAAALLGI